MRASKIYTDWANYYLERAKSKRKVSDLSADCRDGLLLAEVIEAVTTFKVPDLAKKPKTPQHMKIKTRDLIVQGYDTYPGQFPWHVAIFHRKNRHTIEYACGGSLISRNFVLTAAHCTKSKDGYEFSAKRLSVYVGIHDKHELGSNLAQHSVYEIHRVSPEDQWVNLRNDIALLELNGNVRFTNYVQPICLNSLNLSYEAVGTVPGWGRTEEHETSDILKIASLPIVTTIDCLASDRGAFGEMLDNGIICAGYRNGTRVCTGDSGGGLVVKQCSILGCSWTVLGIVSFASSDEKGSCRSDGYGLFTKVQTYLPWIKQTTFVANVGTNP
ncbi:hypothetical protein pipiens_006969 [Culex pipiens pipiens]|uniref:Peptidase S1 domain-containing protein n=1 Tax=Culex pipiens pipiens TaxID=38569 RepID=A0ABD1DP74_CULPP